MTAADRRAVTAERTVHRHWDVAGPPDGPAILFVHGTKVTRNMWHPQIRAFADRYRMVALDLPAHGSRKDDGFRMGDAREIVRAALGEACGGSAIVVGQSLGGYIAMMVAAEHPALVDGLVLSNCSAEPRTVARHATGAIWSYFRMSLRQQIKGHVPGPEEWPEVRAGAADPAPATSGTGESPLPHPNGTAPTAFEPATRGLLFRGSRHALSAAFRTKFRDHLARYPGATLILNGEHDQAFRRSELDFLAACRDGRLVVVPGAGHLVNVEGEAGFNNALAEFVESVHAVRRAAPSATEASQPAG